MGEARRKTLACRVGAIALDTFGGRIHVEWDPSLKFPVPIARF